MKNVLRDIQRISEIVDQDGKKRYGYRNDILDHHDMVEVKQLLEKALQRVNEVLGYE